MTDDEKRPPWRIRRRRYPDGYRWVVMHWIGGKRGVYVTQPRHGENSWEPTGYPTWAEAMADVNTRLAKGART